MKYLTNPKWWAAAGVRALKTLAQAAIATIGSSVVLSSVDWKMVVSSSVLAAILSLLTSLAGLPEVEDEKYQDEKAYTEMKRFMKDPEEKGDE